MVRLRQISLRKFRDEVATIGEVVEVSRRVEDGNIQILGYWTPYMTYPVDAVPLSPLTAEQPSATLNIPLDEPLVDLDPVPGGTTAIRDGQYVREFPGAIKTPDEAKAATTAAIAAVTRPLTPAPKPSQAKKR